MSRGRRGEEEEEEEERERGVKFLANLKYPQCLIKDRLGVSSIVGNRQRGVREVSLEQEVCLCVWTVVAVRGRNRKWEGLRQ